MLEPGVEAPLLGLLVLELLLGLELEELGLEELEEPELMPELDEPELMPPEVAPLLAPCSFFSCACHSDLLICPSWLVSILSNSALSEDEAPAEALLPELEELDGELDEDDDPPAADDLPLVDDEPLDDGVLLCDVEGEALEPELDLLFASSA
ncbi:MAG TPA: hypothetical protein VE325_02500 [Burkholderiales bacterium]|nr:hypothetical protein [Burkholderiales bacterium]